MNYLKISNDELNILNKNSNRITLFCNLEQAITSGTEVGILTERGDVMYAQVKGIYNLMFSEKETSEINKITEIARYRCLRRLYSEFLNKRFEEKESRILWHMSHCFMNYLITRNYFSDYGVDLELTAAKYIGNKEGDLYGKYNSKE